MNNFKLFAILFLACLLVLSSCKEEEKNAPEPVKGNLEVNISGLSDLGSRYVYENWLIVDGNIPISAGRFKVDADGKMSTTSFEAPKDELSKATSYMLTIEPATDNDPGPTFTRVLGGDISGKTATLTTSHSRGLGTDFSSAVGKYRIATPTTAKAILEVSIKGLSDLGDKAVYENWLMVDGKPKSAGTFKVDSKGKMSATTFRIDKSYLDKATAYILTIEPSPDPDTLPSATHLLAADIASRKGTLSVSHASALSTDFTSATGKYQVTAPTTGRSGDDSTGIWWLESPGTQGLRLPTLPNGWIYEGWVVFGKTPVSTGTFKDPAMRDRSAKFSGDLASPNYPGEDFFKDAPTGLTFPTDVRGKLAVISVEPDPDNSPAPFLLKPLTDSIPSDAIGKLNSMDNQATTNNPTGTVTLKDDEESGIWWMEQPGTRGLTLPKLPQGWEYEGWVVFGDTALTTGRFTHTGDTIDDATPHNGPDASKAPKYPGEDFITNTPTSPKFPKDAAFPTTLVGRTAVISVEPEPDNSVLPFALKPLIHKIPANPLNTVHTMNNQSSSNNPKGTLTIK